MYECAECGEEVTMNPDGTLIRKCEHENATVIANLEAVVYGESSVK